MSKEMQEKLRRAEKQVTLVQVYSSKIERLQKKVLDLESIIELLKEENVSLRFEVGG